MTKADIIIVAVALIVLAFIIYRAITKKKKGCAGGCANCKYSENCSKKIDK